MLLFLLFTTFALGEGYVMQFIDIQYIETTFKDRVMRAVATYDLDGDFEATCIQVAKKGTFQSGFDSFIKLTYSEDKVVDRILVDDCETEHKVDESLVEIVPNGEGEITNMSLRYRELPAKSLTPRKKTMQYEVKDGEFVRKVPQ